MISENTDPVRDDTFVTQIETARRDLRATAERYVGASEAEDVVQTAVMRTWRARRSLTGPKCYVKYAMRAVRTASIDLLRSRSAKPALPLADYAADTALEPIDRSRSWAPGPEESAILASEREAAIADLLRIMPRTDAELLYQRYGLAMTADEVQSHAGLTEPQFRNRLYRAKKRARQIPKRFALTGTVIWAQFWKRSIRAKAAFGTVGGKLAVGAVTVGLVVGGGFVFTHQPPSVPSGDMVPVAAVTDVTPSPPAPSTPQDPAPPATPAAPRSSSPAPAPSKSVAKSPAPSTPTRPATPSPRPPVAPPSAPAPTSIAAPTLSSASPSPAASPTPPPLQILAECAVISNESETVAWRVINHTTTSYTLTNLTGSTDVSGVRFGSDSSTRWLQTAPRSAAMSWSAEANSGSSTPAIGGALSGAKIAALPRCQ